MSRRSGARAAAAVPPAPVPMPVQDTAAAARLAGVLRVGEALARHRPAAVGGCMLVDNTVYCFTGSEVMQWWFLLEKVLPNAGDASLNAGLDAWLTARTVNDEAAIVAARFYDEYLQGQPLGLGPRTHADFKDFKNGMRIFREALAALDAKAAEAEAKAAEAKAAEAEAAEAEAAPPSSRASSPPASGGGG